MIGRRRWWAVVGLVGVAAGLSCGDGPTEPPRPVPGVLTVRWTTPHADDRAALLRLVLPDGMTTATLESATPGLEVFERRSADTLRIAVFGELTSAALVRFSVPDVAAASRVVATVVEVSDATDALRASLAGYAVVIEKP